LTGRDAQGVNTAAAATQLLPLTPNVFMGGTSRPAGCVSFRFSDFQSFHINNSLHTVHTLSPCFATTHSSAPNAATTPHMRRQDARTHAGMRKNLNEKANGQKYACRPCCFNRPAVGLSALRDTARGVTDVAGQPIGPFYRIPTNLNNATSKTSERLIQYSTNILLLGSII
jgi:hypothetical protein